MAWSSGGLQLENGAGNIVFAQHMNTIAMRERGNQVISGCQVVQDDAGPNLTVDVGSGSVIANGIVVSVGATNIDLSSEQGALSGGESRFALIHVNSSGTVGKTACDIATTGQQLPEVSSADATPEDEVMLAQITLTAGDTTIETATDIEDWRQFVPDGMYVAGELIVDNGAAGDIAYFGTNTAGNTIILGSDNHSLAGLRGGSGIGLGYNVYASPTVSNGLLVRETNSNGYAFIKIMSDAQGSITFHTVDGAVTADATADNERMRIDSNGNVGIGVDPTAKLHVLTGSNNPLFLDYSGNSDTEALFVKASHASTYTGDLIEGRVTRTSSSAFNLLKLASNDGTDLHFLVTGDGKVGIGRVPSQLLTLGDSDPIMRFHDERDITWTGGEEFASTEYFASDGSGTGAKVINKIAIEIPSAGSTPLGDFVFYTNPAYTTLSEAMRITSSGNVGIGTDTPIPILTGLALYLRDNATAEIVLDHPDASTGSLLGALFFSRDGVDNCAIWGTADGELDSGNLKFLTQPTGGALTEAMRIDQDGNVQFTGDLGVSGDTDLIQLASAQVTINGGIDATDFGSILQANLLSRIANESVSGNWTITGSWIIDDATGLTFNNQDGGSDPILSSNSASKNLTLDGTFVPTSDDFAGLGAASLRWGDIWVGPPTGLTGNPLHITSGGRIWENTSTIRHKKNVIDLSVNPSNMFNLRPVEFDRINTGNHEIGLIAEEIAEYYPEIVNHDEEGQITGYNSHMLQAIIISTLKLFNKRINKLERVIIK